MTLNLKNFNTILTFTAVVPATLLLFMDFIGIVILVSKFDPKTWFIILPMILCLFGYAGLLMNLFWSKNKKFETYTLLFLIIGLLGFSLFTSFTGGFRSWKWLLTMNDFKEWLIFGYPFWISFVLVVIKIKHLMNVKKLG